MKLLDAVRQIQDDKTQCAYSYTLGKYAFYDDRHFKVVSLDGKPVNPLRAELYNCTDWIVRDWTNRSVIWRLASYD